MSFAALRWVFKINAGSPTRKLVLFALADLADDSGECWPTVRHLCAVTELKDRTVREAVADLRAAGLLTTTTGESGVNVFRLNMPAEGSEQIPPPAPAAPPAPSASPPAPAAAPPLRLVHSPPSPSSSSSPPAPITELYTPPLSPPSSAPLLAAPDHSARRLPDDWAPGAAERRFGEGLGLDVDAVAARFCDYWRSAGGQNARKRDWSATWRNWCRSTAERNARSPKPRSSERVEAMLSMMRGFDNDAENNAAIAPSMALPGYDATQQPHESRHKGGLFGDPFGRR